MNRYKLLQLFLNLKKYQQKGLSLVELIVALVISGIVLTAAASGFVNVLRANQSVESKTVRSSTLARALAYMQDEIKQASSLTAVKEADDSNCNTSSGNADSEYCLRLTLPDGDSNSATTEYIYYALDDISGVTSEWLKPGVLRRRRIQEDGTDSGWWAIADGLTSVNETEPSTIACDQDSVNWTGHNTIYGGTTGGKGGFRFCVDQDPTTGESRLARIFLYGHIMGAGDGNNTISASTISFARSE
ncbi:prepilin-type N-terminal cleavage/methylation domain-containing protein [Cyanobacterium aponinum AL20118]|uniref:Prepilin-type N-terminal cleavage/methylation domain-containing protein n=3 Tax=Cyanobacterium aponinum TaxID=379064 RepID=K9Z6M3_CYAAP|nr:prepilin-type N-terminal cleavage/methylation domain-containing protein [Cyanobacterium aponinum]AFZ54784.1 hypothetical protein Cyan10605_2711 [Cyanobacterium aponinum PCC 10605]MBD2395544.1 prepilin-type N-terminal cleavage/methylation domain-containing protein [Cyanobacterium aponinum FACHB-4101]MTF38270.1 prepilin-type N-terminal cleavage/methylation domain-containing protein [Cyanobacterium aponinum 0216]WPF87841.1 prepilin-type N-terminal cleavage/methylation domain-containing protein 